MAERDDFDQKTKDILAKRVGFVCSNPECRASTVGPSASSPEATSYVGIAAHIYSASPNNGPRANPDLSQDERSHISNGIHLCAKCATLIDKNNGRDFPAEILHAWKLQAEKQAIQRLYSYIPQESWKNIPFDNLEQNYASALTCAGLNERHVKSCPQNKKLMEIVCQKLSLGKVFAITGLSGSGKSLATYQCAFDFYLKGWDVFKLVYQKSIQKPGRPIPKNENLLLVVDDAQTIDNFTLQSIVDLADENVLILLNWNLSVERDTSFLRAINTIEINNSEQTEILKKFCLQNKAEITPTLKLFDKDIGEYPLQTSLERKVEIAAREKTPWLFNYSLTNGWRQAKYDKDLLKSRGRQDVVITTVALFQIITLDMGVEEQEIEETIRKFSTDNKFLRDSKTTIASYCVNDVGMIKLKHFEYARRVIANFVPENDTQVIDYFQATCRGLIERSEYHKGLFSFLELLLFDCSPTIAYLKKTKVLETTLSRYLKLEALSEKDVYAIYALLRADNELIHLLESNAETVERWFSNITIESLFGFSQLINQLYTLKYSKDFISSTFLEKLYAGFDSSDLHRVYKFSTVLERLHLYLHIPKFESYREKYRELDLGKILLGRTTDNLYLISFIAKTLFYIDTESRPPDIPPWC